MIIHSACVVNLCLVVYPKLLYTGWRRAISNRTQRNGTHVNFFQFDQPDAMKNFKVCMWMYFIVKSMMHCLCQVAEFLRDKGHEYGTTTSRPRRVGWLDTSQVMMMI